MSIEIKSAHGPISASLNIEIGRFIFAFVPNTTFGGWPPWGSYDPIPESNAAEGTTDYYFFWFRLRVSP